MQQMHLSRCDSRFMNLKPKINWIVTSCIAITLTATTLLFMLFCILKNSITHKTICIVALIENFESEFSKNCPKAVPIPLRAQLCCTKYEKLIVKFSG